jgi:3-hydroxybutyryl-CoA dehydrogenase
MKNIVVIGAGTMGNGIAHAFAQKNFKVTLVDVSKESLEKGLATITKNLDRMLEKEKITADEKNQTLDNIMLSSDLSEYAKTADLIVEAATENLDLKLKIFKQMDELAPEHCILATNTSSISITQIAAATSRPEKVIGMHFMNPVPIMQLVEIIKGYSTSKDTFDSIFELSKTLGKTPTEANDYPGFVANRILMPMINEAIETLYNGVAGVDEIDTVMKLGMAHPMGPLQLADFIGLDVCLAILNVMYDGFKNPKYAPNPLLVNMVMAGKKGVKSGEGFYDYSESKKAEKVSKMFLK